MKSGFVFAFVVAGVLAYLSTVFASDKSTKSAAPLSPDEIAIYKAIVHQYSAKESRVLNVSNTTFPLKPEWSIVDTSRARDECLQGIEFENLSTLATSFHKLPPNVLLDSNSRFVDPNKYTKVVHSNDPDKTMREGKSVDDAVEGAFGTGLFSMSEIAFDRDRHYALVSYRFWCGSLCGNGATMVFEKVEGEWRKADRNCPRWIS